MRTFINHLWRVAVASIGLYIIWIMSMTFAENIIPSGLKLPEASEALLAAMLFTVCAIHALVLYIMICNTKWYGFRLMALVFFMIYIIQFFLAMVETIWFNDSLQMPVSGIKSILLSGFIMSLLYSPLIVIISGRLKSGSEKLPPSINWKESFSIPFLVKILILAAVVYPMIYNLAGYYIAWQFEAVRMYYTGSPDMEPFLSMLFMNINSGLYAFQILRGFIWILLALPLFYVIEGSFRKKGMIIGLLFATLMNAQHLLPNPYFPTEVSFAHLIETYSSNFLWGYIIAWILDWHPTGRLSTAE